MEELPSACLKPKAKIELDGLGYAASAGMPVGVWTAMCGIAQPIG